MDLLKASISKRKAAACSDGPPKKKSKFMTRGEREAAREQKYLEEQRKKEAEEAAKNAHLVKEVEEEEEVKDNNLPVIPEVLPSSEDITRRLRARGDPRMLFGETEPERYLRMVKAEAEERGSNQSGFRNEFAQTIKEDEAQQILDLSAKKDEKERKEARRKAAEEKVQEENRRFAGLVEVKLVEEDVTDEERVYLYFKRLLKMWENQLIARDEDARSCNQGKMDKATWKQSKEYIKPMMKLLKAKALEKDILAHLLEIVEVLEKRNYVRANEIYLRLAIGNAPWPIGVTMVGIHERSGREKIYAQKVAHVLNDETQRKYISSVKRLMTYQQTRFPTDPSRSFGVAGGFQ